MKLSAVTDASWSRSLPQAGLKSGVGNIDGPTVQLLSESGDGQEPPGATLTLVEVVRNPARVVPSRFLLPSAHD